MNKILASFIVCLLCVTASVAQKKKGVINDRKAWLGYLDKIARPVLSNIATEQLKEKMPVALSKNIDNQQSRKQVAYLEAFGRTLSGIAPWLNLEGGTKEEVATESISRMGLKRSCKFGKSKFKRLSEMGRGAAFS